MRADLSRLLRFARYALVGALGTLAHYGVLIALVEAGLLGPAAASTAGAVAGAAVNYALNYRYTFRSGAAHARAVPKFALVAGIGMLLNWALMSWLTGPPGLHYLPAQVAATAAVLIAGYALNAAWTFRTPSK